MAHVYRAIWTDNSLNVCAVLPDEFREWLVNRGSEIPFELGKAVTVGGRTATWVDVTTDLGQVVQLNVREERGAEIGTWTTTFTAMQLHDHNVQWVDINADVSNVWAGFVYAPRAVRNLLLAGGTPKIGRDSLQVQPREVDDQKSLKDLIDGLNDEYREIPYLVLRIGTLDEAAMGMQRATRASETLAGLAKVFVVDEESAYFLNGVLGPELHINELGARLFMPGVMEDKENARLSFQIDEEELDDNQKTLGRLMLRRIGHTSIWPEIPDDWKALKHEADVLRKEIVRARYVSGAHHADDTSELTVPAAGDASEIKRLREELEDMQNQALNASILNEESENNAHRYYTKLMTQLLGHEPAEATFRRGTIPGVIQVAREQAHHIKIPASAERNIEVLERALTAKSWASQLANLFVTMERYARASINNNFSGNFLQWCERGDDGAFAANKIAMQESQLTRADQALVHARTFEVDPLVDPSGYMVMVCHAKIQATGGGVIPRVFFHDDTKGATRKIHIGFIGPHELVPTATF